MPPEVAGEVHVGLISGTSMDGIDAVAVRFHPDAPEVLAATTVPFEHGLAAALDTLRSDPEHCPAARLAELDAEIGEALALAALDVITRAGLKPAGIRAIGSHGQTVLHRPEAESPYSLQIGDPARIARRTGITTVADFRRADIAAGGQGAPLAPLLHDALFRSTSENRAVVNLGGIANLTLLGVGASTQGFDTGPANCLLDEWHRRHHGDRYDAGGRWAASGRVDPAWLKSLLADPYFAAPAPKSTGIEYFSPAWLNRHLPGWSERRPADIQATLADLTARTVAAGLTEIAQFQPDRLLGCGGGMHNSLLLERLAEHLSMPVESTAGHGLEPDYVEAVLFAWLAGKRLDGERIDTRMITGAVEPILAGSVTRV